MEQAARRSHEITNWGHSREKADTHLSQGGNSRGKVRSSTPTDFNDLVATGSQL